MILANLSLTVLLVTVTMMTAEIPADVNAWGL